MVIYLSISKAMPSFLMVMFTGIALTVGWNSIRIEALLIYLFAGCLTFTHVVFWFINDLKTILSQYNEYKKLELQQKVMGVSNGISN